ncbi:carboxypeptidase M32 [Patescibacteria group bacterium]|nr:carboxypeptidase M32 [Patescibacteria group bacterium]
MKVKNRKVKNLLEKYRQISLLGKTEAVLGWDLRVNLPKKGVEGRAAQIAHLTKIITEKWLDPEFKKLVEDTKLSGLKPEEKAILRNLRHAGKFYFKVPKEIIVEFSETTTRATVVWDEARKKDKFSEFLPHLKKLIKLNQIIAGHIGYRDNPYDALLDLYEPDLTAIECKKIFGKLQPELTKILKKIMKSKNYSEKSYLVEGELDYPKDAQEQLCFFVLRRMGYDLEAGRMDDISPSHPFTSELGRFDVRITNRYNVKDFREGLMVAMHEAGHGLYEQGVKEEYSATPLEGGVSLGIHESQSRFWENQVGRSFEFMKFITPIFQAFFPGQLSEVGAETLFSLFNQVRPSFIRTEADEVTYNLHIALRFELEEKMVNGKIKATDLPEIWRVKMKRYLGVTPKTDREGVLQDVHWSTAPMGYFPTYTLGNLYAAQFTREMQKELNLEDLAERGELGTILSWLRANIHQHGGLYRSDELIKKVTGKPLNPQHFLDYINKKYSKIYNLK